MPFHEGNARPIHEPDAAPQEAPVSHKSRLQQALALLRAAIRSALAAGKPKRAAKIRKGRRGLRRLFPAPTAVPPAPPVKAPTTVDRIIAAGLGQVGYHEGKTGGHWNNKEKFSAQVPTLAWVSAGGFPWCAVFVCWCFNQVGALALIPGGPTASVAHFRDSAKAAGQFSEFPAVGAIVIYGTNGDAHTGIVTDFGPDTITAVEGNTNDNGSPEGDGVYVKTRQRRDPFVYGYVYPKFPEGIVSADPKAPKS